MIPTYKAISPIPPPRFCKALENQLDTAELAFDAAAAVELSAAPPAPKIKSVVELCTATGGAGAVAETTLRLLTMVPRGVSISDWFPVSKFSKSVS